jgi:hypothetical protein
MTEVDAEGAKRTRERPCHPELLRARGQLERLDPGRHEPRMAGDRHESDARLRCQPAELAEQVEHVVSSRALAAEDIGVTRRPSRELATADNRVRSAPT